MNLLLISNSTMAGEAYLDYPKHQIAGFLGEKRVQALFIPYAAVTFSYDDYEQKVKTRFNEVGHDIISIHHFSDPALAVNEAEAIVVGGGNTWQLLRMVHNNQLVEPIRQKILNGAKYIGWSAGSNLACPTIKTTNDMPIVDPLGFEALNLIPFQINPHYMDKNPEGHGGETREERILEFLEVNQNMIVVGLREGCMFLVENEEVQLIGNRSLRIFQHRKTPVEVEPGGDLSFLLK